jgi:hypothetical protein
MVVSALCSVSAWRREARHDLGKEGVSLERKIKIKESNALSITIYSFCHAMSHIRLGKSS